MANIIVKFLASDMDKLPLIGLDKRISERLCKLA